MLISLLELNLTPSDLALPADVNAFLDEANRRIRDFREQQRPIAECGSANHGFVSSNFDQVYAVLTALAESELAHGSLFCEWGSGFGVVACLAAMLDFDAFGIEIEGDLVDAARQLAEDFEVPVEFSHGSFIPKDCEKFLDGDIEFSWLDESVGNAHEHFGFAPEDFGVIFAYPWPDEEQLVENLFEHRAGVGAVLVTHHGGDEFRVLRKTAEEQSLPNF